jgi:hypothetical protein
LRLKQRVLLAPRRKGTVVDRLILVLVVTALRVDGLQPSGEEAVCLLFAPLLVRLQSLVANQRLVITALAMRRLLEEASTLHV